VEKHKRQPKPKKAEVFDKDNFEEKIGTGMTFVSFYSPGCEHCKSLTPIWDDLTTKFQNQNGLKIGKIDCKNEVNMEICSQQEVKKIT
jgi:thioredoxin-like negative regulator of GroEL